MIRPMTASGGRLPALPRTRRARGRPATPAARAASITALSRRQSTVPANAALRTAVSAWPASNRMNCSAEASCVPEISPLPSLLNRAAAPANDADWLRSAIRRTTSTPPSFVYPRISCRTPRLDNAVPRDETYRWRLSVVMMPRFR